MAKATISVPQVDANNALKERLTVGEEKEYKELAEILRESFPEINTNQVAGIVNRAHTHEDGVLIKDGKKYRLRLPEEKESINGIEKVKVKIRNLIIEMEQIPISELPTEKDFKEFQELKRNLEELSK